MAGTFDYSAWEGVGAEEARSEIMELERNQSGVDHKVVRAAVMTLERKKALQAAREEREAEAEEAVAARTARRRDDEVGRKGPHDDFIKKVLAGGGRAAKKVLGRAKPGAPTGAAALAAAAKAKDEGNTATGLGDHRSAFWRYTEGVDFVKREPDGDRSSPGMGHQSAEQDFAREPSPKRPRPKIFLILS